MLYSGLQDSLPALFIGDSTASALPPGPGPPLLMKAKAAPLFLPIVQGDKTKDTSKRSRAVNIAATFATFFKAFFRARVKNPADRLFSRF